MTIESISQPRMIAPCGIYCAACFVFLREKDSCKGCWGPDHAKPKHCLVCSIKICQYLAETDSKFCYECVRFPCTRLKQLDKRYQAKYNTSIIKNLLIIEESGLDAMLDLEKVKWKCPDCGGTICIHLKVCMNCKKPVIN
jgi:hypothetical protein